MARAVDLLGGTHYLAGQATLIERSADQMAEFAAAL